MAQPQNRVSRRRTELECFAHSAVLPSVKHAPCGPVLVPVDRGPGAARERMADPRAGTAARFRLSGLPSGKAPSVQRGGRFVTKAGTIVKMRPRKGDETCAIFPRPTVRPRRFLIRFIRCAQPTRAGEDIPWRATRIVSCHILCGRPFFTMLSVVVRLMA
jgi:hypothetical protein